MASFDRIDRESSGRAVMVMRVIRGISSLSVFTQINGGGVTRDKVHTHALIRE